MAREALDATAPPASLDDAVLATETKRSAPKQIYDPSVERKKPQSLKKCSRTPTPPVDGIELPTEASLASNPQVAALIAKARADERRVRLTL